MCPRCRAGSGRLGDVEKFLLNPTLGRRGSMAGRGSAHGSSAPTGKLTPGELRPDELRPDELRPGGAL